MSLINKILFGLLAICMFSVQSLADLGDCDGSFSFNDTDVSVDLDADWRAMTVGIELDDTFGCKDKKTNDDGFLCTKKGNLVTSLINDHAAFSTVFVSGLTDPYLATVADDGGVDAWAVVHMDIFQPGDCAVLVSCDLDNDDGTANVNCFCRPGADLDTGAGCHSAAEASCEDAFSFNGEGMFAAGDDLSTKRHPKSGKNKNWAMAVDLPGNDDCTTLDDTSEAVCEGGNTVTADLIADGGDFGEVGAVAPDDFLEVGLATFTPDGECIWTDD